MGTDKSKEAEAQATNPESIPDLKAWRESRGVSLQDIFLATRISSRNLEAIESGDFQNLPEPVYARNFIRTYASFLDLDSRPILERYERYRATLSRKPAEPQEQGRPAPTLARTGRGKNALIQAVAVAVSILCALVLYLILSHDATTVRIEPSVVPQRQPLQQEAVEPSPGRVEPVPAQSSPSTAVSLPLLSEAPSTGTIKSAEPAPAKEPGGYRLSIKVKDRTWLRIQTDGKREEDFLLSAGDSLERTARTSFYLLVGNAGGIEAEFQGQPLGSLGKSGEVIHIRLPRDGTP